MPPEAHIETTDETLNFPFEDAAHQRESAIFGMWIFLATEVLFFGGMFTGYMVYRYSHWQAFQEAARHQEWYLGCLNTAVLLTSGFTMAIAVDLARARRRFALLALYAVTWLLGAAFLGIEAYEYHTKFVKHLVPGSGFHFAGSDPASSQLFFVLYFTMTGMHMLHMFIGLMLILFFGGWTLFSPRALRHPNCFEVLGLYWAFVDIVWLFLFPLFYLVNPK
jgi:cytochrome c oxidase subunit 3